MLKSIPKKGDLTIGIDEHSKGKQKLALTITLIRPKRALLAILARSNKQKFINFCLNDLTKDQRLRVKEISTDMKKSFKTQLKKFFPNAKLVIDKFHVIAYLNIELALSYRLLKNCLPKNKQNQLPCSSGLFKALRISANQWSKWQKEHVLTVFKLIPEMAKLYWLKEDIRSAYQLGKYNKNKARKMFKTIINQLPEKPKKNLSKHLTQILNHFDNLTTNAYTEGVHTKFKLTKRISYGLRNNEVYVNKLLLPFVKVNTLV
jgi:transposase